MVSNLLVSTLIGNSGIDRTPRDSKKSGNGLKNIGDLTGLFPQSNNAIGLPALL